MAELGWVGLLLRSWMSQTEISLYSIVGHLSLSREWYSALILVFRYIPLLKFPSLARNGIAKSSSVSTWCGVLKGNEWIWRQTDLCYGQIATVTEWIIWNTLFIVRLYGKYIGLCLPAPSQFLITGFWLTFGDVRKILFQGRETRREEAPGRHKWRCEEMLYRGTANAYAHWKWPSLWSFPVLL